MQSPLIIAFSVLLLLIPHCGAYLAHLRKHEKCINIWKCEPVIRLLSNQVIKSKIHNEVRQAICGFEGDDPKIFCDIRQIIPKVEQFEIYLAAVSQTSHSTTYTPTSTSNTEENLNDEPIENHANFRLLEHDLCGSAPVQLRIYGGAEAKIHEFPWMALLAYDAGENYGQLQFRCGATIINRRHVLTAAHCVTDLPQNLKFARVRVGEYDLTKERDCEVDDNGFQFNCNERYQDFEVEKVFAHSQYSTVNLRNDIALIRLKGAINFKRSNIRPICLPLTSQTNLPGKIGIVTGWGSTEHGSPTSDILLKVSLPIVAQETCSKAYSDQEFIKIWDKQICAGGVFDKDSCTGDSGGPLQMVARYREDKRIVQYGIVSFGRKACALRGSPGVYTNVAYYVGWILDRMKE